MGKQMPQSLQDALAFIADYIEAPLPPVRLALSAAFGHMLAEDVRAPVSLPRNDLAAMDGFAVRSTDVREDGTAKLIVGQTITAGQTKTGELRRGEAARITTGALMPPGADRVVVVEDAQVAGGEVRLQTSVNAKPHIRRIGEDVARGLLVLEAGVRLGPGQLALLTAFGLRSVLVFPRPKVGLLSTGDELVQSPGFVAAGQIYDTNRPMLLPMLQAAGSEVTDLGIAKDDPEEILARLVEAARDHDLPITSGGASVGFADHMTEVVSRRGYLEFWKLALRPGKPIGFGDVDDCPILLLPGNPLAAIAGFALVGRALVARLEGRKVVGSRAVWRLPVSGPLAKPSGRTDVLLGRLRHDPSGGATAVEPLPYQGSASPRYLAEADVLIVLHAEQAEIRAGEPVEVLPIWQDGMS